MALAEQLLAIREQKETPQQRADRLLLEWQANRRLPVDKRLENMK